MKNHSKFSQNGEAMSRDGGTVSSVTAWDTDFKYCILNCCFKPSPACSGQLVNMTQQMEDLSLCLHLSFKEMKIKE